MNSGKSKQRSKCRKNNNRFKELKINIKTIKEKEVKKKKKKEISTELQKPNVVANVYNNN